MLCSSVQRRQTNTSMTIKGGELLSLLSKVDNFTVQTQMEFIGISKCIIIMLLLLYRLEISL